MSDSSPATSAAALTSTPAVPVTPPLPAAPALPPTITYDDFAKVELCIAKILECREHPKADKLLILKVDIGEPEPRQVCAGIRGHYAPTDLVGKLVVLVKNLAPRMLRGEVSNGMVLAASPPDKSHIILLTPMAEIAPGSKVS